MSGLPGNRLAGVAVKALTECASPSQTDEP